MALKAKGGGTRWTFVLVPGVLVYCVPIPGLNPAQRHLLAIFLATIISMVAQPVPMSVSVFLSITILALTRTLPANRVLSGFANPTVWLVFAATLFSRAVISTGLGLRLAYFFISRFGHTALRLAYSLAAAVTVLAPVVPSDTARGGGIIYPITRSLAQVFDSEPGPTARRLGSFLMLGAFHCGYLTSAMFLTGMSGNLITIELARKIAHVDLGWMTWFVGASVPGLLSLLFVPYVIYRVHPPELRDTKSASALAGDQLRKMGKISRNERWLTLILVAAMAGWITTLWHGTPIVIVALAGVCALLLTGVLTAQDLLTETKAWDVLIWFAGVLMMAEALQDSGVIGVISASVVGHIKSWPWWQALAVLVIAYVYAHYTFASMTAQITALFPSFLSAALLAGVSPMLAVLPFAYFSNLNAGLTHYGTGSAPIFFGSGYVSQGTWWKVGFVVSLVNLVIWLGIGPLWWKLAGLW
ncbi:MAG: anion permease [Verrucomicrobia bacterium]|nr:MAG: anion permease [Verrucomicrobiota bacterium]